MISHRFNDFFQRYEPVIMTKMIGIYCHGDHQTHDGLCPECEALKTYALARLESCPLHPRKPVCARCPVHCYKTDMRQQIRAVMRYAGPRMLYKAPPLTLVHGIHSLMSPR